MIHMDYKTCRIRPRTKQFWYYSEVFIKWSFPMSIWGRAKWVKDEGDLNNKTFEHDWGIVNERLPKAIKDDEAEKLKIFNVIKPVYNLFRWLYK